MTVGLARVAWLSSFVISSLYPTMIQLLVGKDDIFVFAEIGKLFSLLLFTAFRWCRKFVSKTNELWWSSVSSWNTRYCRARAICTSTRIWTEPTNSKVSQTFTRNYSLLCKINTFAWAMAFLLSTVLFNAEVLSCWRISESPFCVWKKQIVFQWYLWVTNVTWSHYVKFPSSRHR